MIFSPFFYSKHVDRFTILKHTILKVPQNSNIFNDVSKGVRNKIIQSFHLPHQADVQSRNSRYQVSCLSIFLNKNIFLKINIYVLLPLKIVNLVSALLVSITCLLHCRFGLLWYLTPHSTIFQFYHGSQFYSIG